jgi:hypothetical protein
MNRIDFNSLSVIYKFFDNSVSRLEHNDRDALRQCSKYLHKMINKMYFSNITIDANNFNKTELDKFAVENEIVIDIKNVKNNLQLSYFTNYTIKSIWFDDFFNEELYYGLISDTVKCLHFGGSFNKSITKFPPVLDRLIFDNRFYNKINMVPTSISYLKYFNQVIFKAIPYIVTDVNTKQKYAIITSNEYPYLRNYQKNLKIKYLVNGIDDTYKLESTRYYILIDGFQLYTGIFNANNILPVDHVPFYLIKHQRLDFVFPIFDECTIFEFDIDIDIDILNYTTSWNRDINWFHNEKKDKTRLRFSEGYCGLITRSPTFVSSLGTIINYSNSCIKSIDSAQYNHDNNQEFFLSITIPLYTLFDTNIKYGAIYDKQYYKFTTSSSNYKDNNFSYHNLGDAICNFILIHYTKSQCNMNPIINICNSEIKHIKSHHDDEKMTYYFESDRDKINPTWFIIKNNINSINIYGLLKGDYILIYERIICNISTRKLLIDSCQNSLVFNENLISRVID